MKHYLIKGTIKICVGGSPAKTQIFICPCAGYTVPGIPKDQPQKVIAYPDDYKNSDKTNSAKLIKLTENNLECDVAEMKDYLLTLVAIAAQQKLVELRLDLLNEQQPKIIGFTFPTN